MKVRIESDICSGAGYKEGNVPPLLVEKVTRLQSETGPFSERQCNITWYLPL